MDKHPDQKFFRRLFNDFIKKPSYESFVHICVEILRTNDCGLVCDIVGSECSSDSSKCIACPLARDYSGNSICDLMTPDYEITITEYWDSWHKHQGEILISVVQFVSTLK